MILVNSSARSSDRENRGQLPLPDPFLTPFVMPS